MQCGRLLACCAALCAVAIAQSASAQISADVQYCLSVAEALSIIGPVAPLSIVHDGSANDQPFSPSSWTCINNDADGAIATFTTLQAMTHQVVPTVKRDVRLTLSVTSQDAGANWLTTVPTDQTDYANVIPDEIATVQAESTGPGDCVLELNVEFLTGDLATLIPGIYCTTITATITPK